MQVEEKILVKSVCQDSGENPPSYQDFKIIASWPHGLNGCKTTYLLQSEGSDVMHSATGEAARRDCIGALDCLALALADKGHKWTGAERSVYEKAIRLLSG